MSIALTKLIDDAIDKGSLQKCNGARRSVTDNGDTKGVFDVTKVGEFPVLTKIGFESGIFVSRGRGHDDVVDMYSKDGGASSSVPTVDAPFAGETLEAHKADRFVERFIPDAGRLLHAIKTLHKFPDPILLSGGLKTGGLFNDDGLGAGEDAVEESGLNINMLDIPVKDRSDVKDDAKGLKVSCGGGGLIIVNVKSLGKSFCNVADFVAGNVTSIVALTFADEFSFQWSLVMRDFRAGNEDKDLEVGKAF